MGDLINRALILSLILALFNCAGIDSVKHLGERTSQELSDIEFSEIFDVLSIYKANHGYWPSQEALDSLKNSNTIFKRLSGVTLQPNAESISVSCTINYEKSFSSIESIKLTYSIYKLHPSISTGYKIDNITYQDNLDFYKLPYKMAKRKFKNLEKDRKNSLGLIIQDIKNGNKKRIPIGSVIAAYYEDTYSDKKSEKLWFGELDRINSNDSSINLRLWGMINNENKSFARIRLEDIKSLKLIHRRKADDETYKAIEIVE